MSARVVATIATTATVAAGLAACGSSTGAAGPSARAARTRDVPLPAWPKAKVNQHAAAVPRSAPTTTGATGGTSVASGRIPRPAITMRLIPFGPQRRAEMVAYAERHYGLHTYRLVHPQVIVEHVTETTTADAAYNTFVSDTPDSELHELPGTCAHFIVGSDGTIYQLVPITTMCRHTVGLNWTAIGIEHVGMSDADVMDNSAELRGSLTLTRWLRCSLGIKVRNIIGHNESLSSPFHHELVAALRTQTHGDMQPATMTRYRALVARQAC